VELALPHCRRISQENAQSVDQRLPTFHFQFETPRRIRQQNPYGWLRPFDFEPKSARDVRQCQSLGYSDPLSRGNDWLRRRPCGRGSDRGVGRYGGQRPGKHQYRSEDEAIHPREHGHRQVSLPNRRRPPDPLRLAPRAPLPRRCPHPSHGISACACWGATA
jgi:hypothetical protein